jgi:hypothetical protein
MRYSFKNTALLAMALAAERIKATMEYVDAQCLLDDAHAYTASAVSTNTYDTLTATNDIGVGEELAVEVSVDVSADITTGDETYTFNVISSAAAALSSPTVLNSRTLPAAQLTAGSKFFMLIPGGKTQRYLGLSLTMGGTTPTITITANVKAVSMTETLKYYPKNYTIS